MTDLGLKTERRGGTPTFFRVPLPEEGSHVHNVLPFLLMELCHPADGFLLYAPEHIALGLQRLLQF